MKLVTNTDEFFKELKQKDIRIGRPALIVLALAILASAYEYQLGAKISQAFPSEIAEPLMIEIYILMIASFVGIIALWPILALIMHGLSALFRGKGSLRRTFEFTGYGFLPPLIGSLITVPVSLYYISQAEIPKVSLTEISQNPQIVDTLIHSIIPDDLIYSNLIINILMTVWSLTIWAFAIKNAREIKLGEAFICVLIPAIIFTIYQIYSVLSML